MSICTKRTIVILAALVYALSLLACISPGATPVASGKPVVQIVSPAAGAQFPPGTTVTVQIMTADAAGIARVELLVDNVLVATNSLQQPMPTWQGALVWVAATPGAHTLLVRATNVAGAASDPAVISVLVTDQAGPTQVVAQPPATTAPGVTTVPPTQKAPVAPTKPPTAVPPTKPPTQPAPALPKADLEIVSLSLTNNKLELLVRNNRGDELVSRVVLVENTVNIDPGGQVGQAVTAAPVQQTIAAKSGQTISVFVDPAVSLDLAQHSYEIQASIGPQPGDPNSYEETNAANNAKTGAWQKQAPQQTTLTAAFVPNLSGNVSEDGLVEAGLPPNPRDGFDNKGWTAFFSFNITSLPSDAHIVSAVLEMGSCSTAGNPFVPQGLGPLRVYYYYYGDLEAKDYQAALNGELLGQVQECTGWGAGSIDVTASVQAHSGPPYYQVVAYFPIYSNGNDDEDGVRFSAPTLTIVYTMP
ncbi:MAG: hypothetical protein KKA73_26080 [Chloroflexi bacterium]|nr:hypothetical protein [Chloroflexota bacterium]MBU1751168.1 hypothetical protein [Chloroflexota bacterium]